MAAGTVGALPAFAIHRRVMRSIPNEYDVSTVVSIFPKKIVEEKPTLASGRFTVEAGSFEIPSLLHVNMSFYYHDPHPDQPIIEVPVPSVLIADSIVKDYCNSYLEYKEDASPGLFVIPGQKIDLVTLKIKFSDKLMLAKIRQDNWYKAMVRLADSLWARSNGNPLAVPDDCKMAAEHLGILEKEWMKTHVLASFISCKACGTRISDTIIVCPNCKVVLDSERFKALNLEFAK